MCSDIGRQSERSTDDNARTQQESSMSSRRRGTLFTGGMWDLTNPETREQPQNLAAGETLHQSFGVHYYYDNNELYVQNAFEKLVHNRTASKEAFHIIDRAVKGRIDWLREDGGIHVSNLESRGLWDLFKDAMANYTKQKQKLDSRKINAKSTKSDRQLLVRYAKEITSMIPGASSHRETEASQVSHDYGNDETGLQTAYVHFVHDNTTNQAAFERIDRAVQNHLNWIREGERASRVSQSLWQAEANYSAQVSNLRSVGTGSSIESDRQFFVEYAQEIISTVREHPDLS